MPQPPIRAKRNSQQPDSYLNHVPNRDLTEEDWDALDADQRDHVRKSGLYDVPTEAQFRQAKEKAEKPPDRPSATQATVVRQAAPSTPETAHAGHPAPTPHMASPAATDKKEAK